MEEMWKNSAIITKRNVDDNEDPISIQLSEFKQVMDIHSCIVLNQLPDMQQGVYIEGFTEVFDIEKLSSKNYKVDYANGVIYFNPVNIGKTLTVEYEGIGYTLLSASRIYTKYDKNGNILETLEELIDRAKLYIKAIETLGGAVEVINKLDQDIVEGNELHNELVDDISVGTQVKDELVAKTETGQTTINSLVEKTNTGNQTVTQLIDKNNIATQKKQALDISVTQATNTNEVLTNTNQSATQTNLTLQQTIATASEDIAKINATQNKSLIIGASQFINNQYTWTHNINSDNLIVVFIDSVTNEPLMLDYKIIDKNNILIRNSAEHPNIKVVLSASYYQGNSLLGSSTEEFAGDSIDINTRKVLLKDASGVIENPVTNSDAVFMSDGTTKLTKKVSDIEASLTEKVNATESTLKTTSKTVIGAINEVFTTANDKVVVTDSLASTSTVNALSAKQGKVLNDGKIDKTAIVDNCKDGGSKKVLSAEQGKILNNKIDSITSNATLNIVDSFKKAPFTDDIQLNSTIAENYNADSYGTPKVSLIGEMVSLTGNINLKATTSGRIGYIPNWLLPTKPVLVPTSAFNTGFTKSVASSFAIWGNRSSSIEYGDIRLEVDCLEGNNKFIGLSANYKAPFSDLNGAYDFTTKLNTVQNRKGLNGGNIPISILMTADTHWQIPENTDNLYSRQYRAFNWLGGKINPNFSLIMGDYMSEWDGLTTQGLDAMRKKWEAFRYMLRDNTLLLKGNHDDASQVGLLNTSQVISTERMWDWAMDGKSGLNLNPLEPKNFYYYVDDGVSRTRHIMLNTVDIPYSTGSTNTYKGFDTFVIRKKQIEWLINVALKVPADWDVAVYSHHSLHEGITATDKEVVNRDVVKKVLVDFMNGSDSTITSTTSGLYPDFYCTVNTNFSSQGARKLIGNFFGHHHKDFFLKVDGINHIGMASMKPSNTDMSSPWNRSETGLESFCADCIQIDVVAKKVYLTRFGFGSDRTFTY